MVDGVLRRQHVGDGQRAAFGRQRRPVQLRPTAEPALDGIIEHLLARPMLHRDAHPREVGGERYRRPAVALRMLKRVRVDDETPPSGEGDVAVLPDRLVVEQRLATLRSSLDRQAAPVAAIRPLVQSARITG